MNPEALTGTTPNFEVLSLSCWGVAPNREGLRPRASILIRSPTLDPKTLKKTFTLPN